MKLNRALVALPARIVLTGILAGLAASSALAADLAAGQKIAEERCAACHGKDYNTPIDPSYPKLAGQHEDYLYAALREYKRESRKNAIMGAQAKALSDADMNNLSAYFASLKGDLYLRR